MNKQIVKLIGQVKFLEAINWNDKVFYSYLITTDKYNAFEFSCDIDIRNILEKIEGKNLVVECYLTGKLSKNNTRFISLKANKIYLIGWSWTKNWDDKKTN